MERIKGGVRYVTLAEWAASVGITHRQAKNWANKGRLRNLVKLMPVDQGRYFIPADVKIADIPYYGKVGKTPKPKVKLDTV